MIKSTVVSAILLLMFCTKLVAEIRLPGIISSNMVLQQQANAKLWGNAEPNTKVIIRTSWNNRKYVTLSNDNGEWLQAVQTPVAGGPYKISISDGKEVILNNVLIGEVWLCSGQSNMEHTMTGYPGQPTEHSLDYINQAISSLKIRVATVRKEYDRSLRNDCHVHWEENTPASVRETSATAYFFAAYLEKILNVPIGIICSSWGGSKIEAWLDRKTFTSNFPETDLSVLSTTGEVKRVNQQPTFLYNAMINPLLNYSLRGVIWYQGESNRDKPGQYERLQVAMMNLWREKFNNHLMPFYYVQIAPYQYDSTNDFTSGFFYEAQSNIMKEDTNCGMVVTIDIGEEYSIHPKYKREVGNRLAYWALAKTYGKGVVYKGPNYKKMEIKNDRILVFLDDENTGIWSLKKEISGFEISGENREFVSAKAKIVDRKYIEVWSDNIKNPVAVRYCFRNYQPGTIFNNYHLPLAPFRTDNWGR